MIPVQISINKNDIIFRTGDEKMVYKTDVNAFLSETGLTIQNIRFPIISTKVFYIKLAEKTSTFSCGNTLDNILLEIEREIEEGLLIIDFDNVEEVSSSFLQKYVRFLLETSNKIITINMSLSISNAFNEYIILNIIEEEE